MSRKPKGYGKRGRPIMKQVKELKTAQALIESKTAMDAYRKLHPNASEASVVAHYTEIVTPEVLEKMERILQLNYGGPTTRTKIEKVLWLIVARYMNGQENAQAAIACMRELERLVPDFKDRAEVVSIPQSVEEIDRQLKELGFDPSVNFPRN